MARLADGETVARRAIFYPASRFLWHYWLGEILRAELVGRRLVDSASEARLANP